MDVDAPKAAAATATPSEALKVSHCVVESLSVVCGQRQPHHHLSMLFYCCVPFFEDWPANSPDLNPIKNLWATIKELCSHDCYTVAKFRAAFHHL